MKNKEESKKSVVKIMREIRDNINLEIQDLTTEEIKEYFRNKLTIHPTKYNKHRTEIA